MAEKEREYLTVPEKEIDNFTGDGPWEIKDETYIYVEDFPSRDCDGECHNVVVRRVSDLKYFKFFWMYTYSQNYRYGETWKEVFPKTITTTTWE